MSFFAFVFVMCISVCTAMQEPHGNAPNSPDVASASDVNESNDVTKVLQPPQTVQKKDDQVSFDIIHLSLLAVIALLLLSILCVLILNRLTNKQRTMFDIAHPLSISVLPPTGDLTSDNESQMVESSAAIVPAADPEPTIETTPLSVKSDSSIIKGQVPATDETETAVVSVPPSAVAPPQDALPLIKQLTKDFETKLKYDASKQELIDKLYKENIEFKEGIIKKFQQAMILAVIERVDDAAKDIAVFENREYSEENYRKLLASYNDITAGFQDMLSIRFDVESYSGAPLTRFDPKMQRSLKTCPTAEADKNKLVKQTLRPGYKTAEGFVLRPELVEVYVFDEKQYI